MADINQTITLGIGTPAGIPEFLLFGLQIGAVVEVETTQGKTFVVATEVVEFAVPEETREFIVQ